MDPFKKMHQQFSDAYHTLTDIGTYPYIIKPFNYRKLSNEFQFNLV